MITENVNIRTPFKRLKKREQLQLNFSAILWERNIDTSHDVFSAKVGHRRPNIVEKPSAQRSALLDELQVPQLRQFQIRTKELIQVLTVASVQQVFQQVPLSSSIKTSTWKCPERFGAPKSYFLIKLEDTLGHIQHGAAMPQLSNGNSIHVKDREAFCKSLGNPSWLKIPLVMAWYSWKAVA